MKDYSRFKAAYRKRRTEEEKKRKAGALKAARAAEKVAAMLARAYGVKKVVLFGSVIDGRFPRPILTSGLRGLRRESI